MCRSPFMNWIHTTGISLRIVNAIIFIDKVNQCAEIHFLNLFYSEASVDSADCDGVEINRPAAALIFGSRLRRFFDEIELSMMM